VSTSRVAYSAILSLPSIIVDEILTPEEYQKLPLRFMRGIARGSPHMIKTISRLYRAELLIPHAAPGPCLVSEIGPSTASKLPYRLPNIPVPMRGFIMFL
jgi:hypothetical protein